MARVYLLGAGFSRAISNEMPTMKELSDAIKETLGDRKIPGAKTPIASNFEQWLSYLIETPPWLSESDQAYNRAAFFEVARAVYDVLSDHQERAVLSGEPPEWLQPLMVYWQATPTTVITFNYDLFVELAWLRSLGDERSWRRSHHLFPGPITPIEARFGYQIGGMPARNGLRLLKLHGSLNWRYSGPGSTAGDIIYDLGVSGSGWNVEGIGPFEIAGQPDPHQLAVDREPMIVPPAAVKSPYYNNRTLQALWLSAADALRQAEELVIMGFSLPQTDLLVSSMLATTLPEGSSITPVDRSIKILDRVAETLDLKEFQGARINSSFAGLENPLPAWVEANTGE